MDELKNENLNDEEGIDEGFQIDTPAIADWAIQKVREEQDRMALYRQAVEERIKTMQEELQKEERKSEGRTTWLKFKLNEYLDHVPARKTKTKVSLKLPSGTIERKMETFDYIPTSGQKDIKTNTKVLEWVKENVANANEMVEQKESLKWKEFKENLQIIGDDVFYKPTGEMVDVLSIVKNPIKIEVK